MDRLIVLSRAYQQASEPNAASAAIDPDNRLLWRANRLRLDADQYRDAALQTAGRIDFTMGGPGVNHFKQGPGPQMTPALDYAAFDWESPAANRRSVYRTVWRSIPDPFMDSLDFPDLTLLSPTRGSKPVEQKGDVWVFSRWSTAKPHTPQILCCTAAPCWCCQLSLRPMARANSGLQLRPSRWPAS